MKRSLTFLALFAAGIALAQAAPEPTAGTASEAKRVRGDLFAERDGNNDGQISLAEWQQAEQARQKTMFDRLDANRDGRLTREEVQAQREQRRQQMHERRGQHRDGMKKLQELDKDGDQALSRAEIGDQLPKLSENFDRLDADRDGKLTREEMRAGRAQMRSAPGAK